MINVAESFTVTRLLAAGTYTNPITGSGVDIRDYTGQVAVIVDCGPAQAGSGTAALQMYVGSSGTQASGFSSFGTLTSIPAAGGTSVFAVDTQACQRYLRVTGDVAASGRFPVSVSIVGKKINEP